MGKKTITWEEVTAEDRIKLLHKVVDNLKGSTSIEIEINQSFMHLPGTGMRSEVVKTGEICITISAYDPNQDGRKTALGIIG